MRGRLNHELAHYLRYVAACGRRPPWTSNCGYGGKHDARFYRILEQLHRKSGVPKPVAARVEGRYRFPPSWADGKDWR